MVGILILLQKVVNQMVSNLELTNLFFSELKHYNTTNFRTLATADLSASDPVVHKAFSSVVTRYLIFCDKHPEVSQSDKNMLYFKLKIDMIAYYFSQYPSGNLKYLQAFQLELLQYLETQKLKNSEISKSEIAVEEATIA